MGAAALFLTPKPDRALICGYRGAGPDSLRFVRGTALPNAAAIADLLNTLPHRLKSSGSMQPCPDNQQEALVISFGYVETLPVQVTFTQSGCAYEWGNDVTVDVPPATMAVLRGVVWPS
jgi:hypothetical protein